jgi:hypothetical protein
MNENPPTEPPAEIVGFKFAQRLAAALIAAFVLIVVCAFIDRANRAQLESAKPQAPAARPR